MVEISGGGFKVRFLVLLDIEGNDRPCVKLGFNIIHSITWIVPISGISRCVGHVSLFCPTYW